MKKTIKITTVILIICFLCLIIGKGFWERTKQKEHWTDSLLARAQNQDYACAFIWVDSGKADFHWEFYEDSDSLAADFLEKKKDMAQNEKDGMAWSFVKLRLDEDIYGMDIYEYFEQNLPYEGYEYRLTTFPDRSEKIPDNETPYYIEQIRQEEHDKGEYLELTTWKRQEAVIFDKYLYILACDEDITEENEETVASDIMEFHDRFVEGYYGTAWILDEDMMHWLKYTRRESRLENPERIFIEERASNYYLFGVDHWLGYFGLVKEAEYQVKIAPNLPEMTIHFRFAGEAEKDDDGFELKIRNRNAHRYRMEVRIAEDNRLLQEREAALCIWQMDTISFEDLDGDGYLDMKVSFPEYDSVDGTIYDEDYLLWNQEMEKFEYVNRAVLLARQEENAVSSENAAEADTRHDRSVLVEDGDCLWKLAERYYGDGARWRELYEYNQETIGENPSLILPGTELEIP